MKNFSEETKNLLVQFMNIMEPKDLETLIESQKLMVDSAFFIIKSHSDKKSKQENEANLLFQMTALKSMSLLPFLEENKYVNRIDNTTFTVPLDPFSISSIVRSQLEAYVNFNNIYIQSNNEEETLLKYNLWVASGLSYRQMYQIDQISKNAVFYSTKKEKERLELELLETSILQLLEKMGLTGESKKIKDLLKRKEWKISLSNEKIHFKSWHELLSNSGTNEILQSLYSLLSLNAHPSNVSVFQFAGLYRQNEEFEHTSGIIRFSMAILAFFIRDYVTYFNLIESHFSKLPTINKLIIDSYNKLFKSEAFQLTDFNSLLIGHDR